MPRLHSVKPVESMECIRALEKLGFRQVRQSGSHVIMHSGGRSVPVLMHKGRDIPVGTLTRIIAQAGVSADEFLQSL